MYQTEGYMRPIEGFMDQVARQCVEYLRTGGGPLTKEEPNKANRFRVFVTPAQREKMDAMLREKCHTADWIARKVGCSRRAVFGRAERLGLKTKPQGRRKA